MPGLSKAQCGRRFSLSLSTVDGHPATALGAFWPDDYFHRSSFLLPQAYQGCFKVDRPSVHGRLTKGAVHHEEREGHEELGAMMTPGR